METLKTMAVDSVPLQQESMTEEQSSSTSTDRMIQPNGHKYIYRYMKK